MGQHFPLAASALDVKDAIEDFSEINFYRMSKAFRSGQQRLKERPLIIAQITGVGFAGRIGNDRETTHELGDASVRSSLKPDLELPSRL